MAFERESPIPHATSTPTAIGDVRIHLHQKVGSVLLDRALVHFVILDQDGEEFKAFTVDLIPHITAPQEATLLSIISGIRVKLVDEVLPLP